MIKKTVKYTDFNGVERSEDFYFNLTKTELNNLNFKHHGTYGEQLKSIADSNDVKLITELFSEIIKSGYGIKSEDGRNFRKSQQILDDFVSSAAYDALMSELLNSADKAADLFIGMLPSDLQGDVRKEIAKEKKEIQ